MTAKRTHYVRFSSPGTFVDEESSRRIDSWDTVKAVEMAETVLERYDAKPYGFQFTTSITHDPIPDGEGERQESGSPEHAPATEPRPY